MRVGIKVVTLIVIWSAMDTILLFFFLKGFRAKEKMGIFTTISYLFYFLLNFVFGIKNVNIWIHILCNIILIVFILYFIYDGINGYEISKKAIGYILLIRIIELLLIVSILFITCNFSVETFLDFMKLDVRIVSMGLSRLIALFLIKVYGCIKKRSNQWLGRPERLSIYLPLVITFFCFLMVFGIALNIDYFEKDNYLLVFAIVASMLLIFTLTYITLFEKYMQLHKENYELLLNKKKEELINEYYNNQKNSIENVRIMYHDLKYYILMSNYDGKYMGEIKKNLKQFEELFDSGDEILNLILWKKKKEALSYGIDFKCFAESLDLSFINSIDICFIMGNVLDNAIEAGKEVLKKEECIIVIKIAQINDLIMFKIVNDCIGASRVRLKDGTFSTTKEIKKLHGIGLHSVLRVVKKYDGNCEFRVAEDKFITEILIPCPIKQ